MNKHAVVISSNEKEKIDKVIEFATSEGMDCEKDVMKYFVKQEFNNIKQGEADDDYLNTISNRFIDTDWSWFNEALSEAVDVFDNE